MPVNDHKTAFFNSIADYSMNTGIIATDTGISAPAGYSSNTTVSSISTSVPSGPYVITSGTLSGGITNYNYQTPDWQNKRIDVRDNGKIPVDIWAMMYNNGVIDD